MNKAHLVARADEHGVYIAATEDQPAQYFKHKRISVCTPEPKARPDKAVEMAYKSFVYARGRFTPGGMDKYLQFRNGRQKNNRQDKSQRMVDGTCRFINAVFLLLADGPSHGRNSHRLHNFRVITD